MTSRETLDPAYFETHFRSPSPVPDWPEEFVIISAYATTGQVWTSEKNENADRRLRDALGRRDGWMVRVTGFSPTTGHAEQSWAADVPFDEACDIGLHFRQDAIYHVRNDALSVSLCDHRRNMVPVGRFRERLHVELT